MLYGRTNANHVWDMKKVSSEPAIIYNDNNKVVPIPGFFEELKEEVDSGLFFYVFSYQKKERFLFATTEKVDFLALNNPENMVISGIVVYVKGVLWDLEKKQFVSFNRPEGHFNEFMLYDAGIPNIIFDRDEKQYTIFCLRSGEYDFYENKKRFQPAIVSHLWKNNKIGRPVNNRLIFTTFENEDDENMLILHEEIECDQLCENVSFVETIPLNFESDSDASFFRSVHGKDAVGHKIIEADPYNVKHLVFDDVVVVEQPYDEYNLVFVDDGNVIFDTDFDCVDYEKIIPGDCSPCKENIIKVYYKKNDFENGEATFNATTLKISH